METSNKDRWRKGLSIVIGIIFVILLPRSVIYAIFASILPELSASTPSLLKAAIFIAAWLVPITIIISLLVVSLSKGRKILWFLLPVIIFALNIGLFQAFDRSIDSADKEFCAQYIGNKSSLEALKKSGLRCEEWYPELFQDLPR